MKRERTALRILLSIRDQWGFKGLVVSSWGSTHFCVPVVRSGLDIEMAGGDSNAVAPFHYTNLFNGIQKEGETLFGKVNPSGKLPITFEKKWEDNPAYKSYYDPDNNKHVQYTEGIFIGYRGYDKLKREVQYPFGYGLSYTTFKISGMSVTGQKADGTVEVTCQLTNTGKRDGAQVVHLRRKDREQCSGAP